MKKTLNIVKNALVWTIFAVAVAMMIFTIISVNTFDQNNRNLFGFKAFTVRTDSMSATDFDAGDIVFTKNVAPATLKEGDIIAFISQSDEYYGETITHKIRQKTTTATGEPAFITYGTTTGVDDEVPVEYSFILGKYVAKLPNVGAFFLFLKEPIGYFLCIFIPFLLLILYQGLMCIKLFRRYKKEQMEELNTEREKIEEERKQAAEMMKELHQLKELLSKQEGQPVDE
ncbi:MAG: signal peptidase I [Clostridia bacterium]|nr:signal peptidase I [Clostridia bacterium]